MFADGALLCQEKPLTARALVPARSRSQRTTPAQDSDVVVWVTVATVSGVGRASRANLCNDQEPIEILARFKFLTWPPMSFMSGLEACLELGV
jgi:hypothetical protein